MRSRSELHRPAGGNQYTPNRHLHLLNLLYEPVVCRAWRNVNVARQIGQKSTQLLFHLATQAKFIVRMFKVVIRHQVGGASKFAFAFQTDNDARSK